MRAPASCVVHACTRRFFLHIRHEACRAGAGKLRCVSFNGVSTTWQRAGQLFPEDVISTPCWRLCQACACPIGHDNESLDTPSKALVRPGSLARPFSRICEWSWRTFDIVEAGCTSAELVTAPSCLYIWNCTLNLLQLIPIEFSSRIAPRGYYCRKVINLEMHTNAHIDITELYTKI